MTQQIFGPDQRDGRWFFYAYIDGRQVEWGPYRSKEFAQGALKAIEKRLNEVAATPPASKLPEAPEQG